MRRIGEGFSLYERLMDLTGLPVDYQAEVACAGIYFRKRDLLSVWSRFVHWQSHVCCSTRRMHCVWGNRSLDSPCFVGSGQSPESRGDLAEAVGIPENSCLQPSRTEPCT